nr:hypothetical protein NG677_05100 [Methylobacterium sp. OTU13CASTA1]
MGTTNKPEVMTELVPKHNAEGLAVPVAASIDIITEAEAYLRFGHLLEDKELRFARQDGRLGYLRRKRTIFYRLSELQAFVNAALEREYVRAPQSVKPRVRPVPVPAFSVAPIPASRPTPSPSTEAALTRLAKKIARVEGRA